MTAPVGLSQSRAATVAGAMYLITMATAVFDEIVVKGGLIVSGDATATATNIVAHELRFRLGLAASLLTSLGVTVLVWALYVLLRPVNKDLALLAAVIRWAENAVSFVAVVFGMAALSYLGNASYLKAFADPQLHVLARMLLRAQGLGLNVTFVLLGVGSAIFAHLLLRSGYIPRALAGFGLFASVLLAASSLAAVVFPAVGPYQFSLMMPMGVYEVTLGTLLLVKGVRVTAPGPMPSSR